MSKVKDIFVWLSIFVVTFLTIYFIPSFFKDPEDITPPIKYDLKLNNETNEYKWEIVPE